MDLRTLFLAQTCTLVAIAAMLWIARSEDDRRNGMREWTAAVTAQGLAFMLLAYADRWSPLWSGLAGNALGALGVALFHAAICRFVGRPLPRTALAFMVVAVTAVAALAGGRYAISTIVNGYLYGIVQLANGALLWRAPRTGLARTQRVVAAFYLLMALVLPLRATRLWLETADVAALDYLNMPIDWQQPLYVFAFVFIIVTNLGFLQLCKMRAEAEVREQAMSDGLTGLPNRRALNIALAHELATARRSGQPFAVVMADVDHFKAINDQLGHSAGDATLAAFAARLAAALREQDLPFRYGGEEFCVLLPATDENGAVALAERLRHAVARPAAGDQRALTASFGIAIWRDGDTADALFDRADRALYRAKTAGRDRVELG